MKKIFEKLKGVENNNKIVIKNTGLAFLIKGGALAISLLSTPAFIGYFNNNTILGVWYTLLSVLIWFLNFDLGIGNGIRNQLVKAIANNDRIRAKYIVSSGLAATSGVTIILCIIGITMLKMSNLNNLFNVEEYLISREALFISAGFVFLAIMLRMMLTTVSSIFYALQKSAINNFLSLCVSTLQLLFVLNFHFENAEDALIYLSVAYFILSNLPVVIAAIYIFLTELKDCRPNIHYIKKEYMKGILSLGGVFFICQILYMIIVNTNELFITKLFGPEYTTQYTFYYKLTSLIAMVVALAMTPIWSVVTKAMEENNWIWIGKLYKKIKSIGFIIVLVEFAIIPVLQPVMNVWLGNSTITVDYSIAIAFACFGSVFVYSSMLSTIVCGMARMKLQAVCYAVGVVFKIIFVICLSRITNNWSVVVWSNAILLFPYCVLQQIDLDHLIKYKIKKWMKKTI